MSHITIKDANEPIVKDLYLAYGTDEKVGVAIWEEWRYDPNDPNAPWTSSFWPDPNDPNETDKVTGAIEFRYESGRRRYLLRYWDTHGWAFQIDRHWTVDDTIWADYVGDEPYVDYTVTCDGGGCPVPHEQTRWLAGLGIRGREDLRQSPVPPRFLHGDLIGSTMMETGPTGEVESQGGWNGSSAWQYTAFGEPLVWPGIQRGVGDGRYKYAGAYGYEWAMAQLRGANEALPPILLLHVGERWYEPGTGRFVQRDPIGLGGGVNLYEYVASNPLRDIDAAGLSIAQPVRTVEDLFTPSIPYWAGDRSAIAPGQCAACQSAQIGVELGVRPKIGEHEFDPPPLVNWCPECGVPCRGHIGAAPVKPPAPKPAPPPAPRPQPEPRIPCGPHY